MAQKERSQLKAGLFILFSIALIFGVIVAIKGVKVVFTPVDERHVRFSLSDDVGGLRIGDDVRIGGFKVGVVKTIDLQGLDGATGAPSLLISFSIPQKYRLHDDAHIGIQTTVTGTSVLNIDDIGTGAMLADNTELTGHASALSSLFASLGKSGPVVSDILQHVKTVTVPKLDMAADRAGDTLVSIHGASDQISSVLGDTKPDVRGTMANIHVITDDVKAKLPGIMDHVDTVVVKTTNTIDNAKSTLEDIKVTVANAKSISTNARILVDGNKNKFDTMIGTFKVTLDNLKGFSADLRRSPWRLLYRPGPGEMDNLELYDAARQFSDGANGVNDAAVALRDAMQNPTVDKAEIQKLIDRLNTSFDSFSTVEDKLWKSVKPE
jgi:ABC-type transporter Mla subunit MlaD